MIYFIQATTGGPVKIGYTQKDVQERVSALQTAHAVPLVVLATFPGNKATERMLHEALRGHRLRGEWFADCPEVRAAMAGAPEQSAVSAADYSKPERALPARDIEYAEMFVTGGIFPMLRERGYTAEQIAAAASASNVAAQRWLDGDGIPSAIEIDRLEQNIKEARLAFGVLRKAIDLASVRKKSLEFVIASELDERLERCRAARLARTCANCHTEMQPT